MQVAPPTAARYLKQPPTLCRPLGNRAEVSISSSVLVHNAVTRYDIMLCDLLAPYILQLRLGQGSRCDCNYCTYVAGTCVLGIATATRPVVCKKVWSYLAEDRPSYLTLRTRTRIDILLLSHMPIAGQMQPGHIGSGLCYLKLYNVGKRQRQCFFMNCVHELRHQCQSAELQYKWI